MSPLQFQQELKRRGFTLGSSGTWHGPWGLTVPGTWNTLNTTSLADNARGDIIRQLDSALQVKRRDFNDK